MMSLFSHEIKKTLYFCFPGRLNEKSTTTTIRCRAIHHTTKWSSFLARSFHFFFKHQANINEPFYYMFIWNKKKKMLLATTTRHKVNEHHLLSKRVNICWTIGQLKWKRVCIRILITTTPTHIEKPNYFTSCIRSNPQVTLKRISRWIVGTVGGLFRLLSCNVFIYLWIIKRHCRIRRKLKLKGCLMMHSSRSTWSWIKSCISCMWTTSIRSNWGGCCIDGVVPTCCRWGIPVITIHHRIIIITTHTYYYLYIYTHIHTHNIVVAL